MHLLKFSFFSFLLMSPLISFEGKRCFDSNFEVTVKHKGWPFGLSENVITVRKDKCDLKFSHERMKYLKSFWHIDVCREPVHVKKGSGTIEVIKRASNCSKSSDDSFCSEMKKLRGIIQDDGLIFAKGTKENLQTDHGRVYCAYRLMSAYISGNVLSPSTISTTDFSNMLENKVLNDEDSAESVAPRPEMDGNVEEIKQDEDSATIPSGSSTGSF